MNIHADTVEEVKEKADIIDIISEYVVLRKRGHTYQGLCPFHEEKTPSFTVNPTKQMYYCFGCQSGGNIITFLKTINKQSFAEVVLSLAKRYQIPVKTLDSAQNEEFKKQLSLREQLYEILASATSFYQHTLKQSSGKLALEYLTTERRLTDATLQKFKLGYAPPGWDTIYNYLVTHKGYPVQLVEKSGLIVLKNSGNDYYDRFRNRLMIPIHDLQGRIIGFGGRTLTNEEPKYLNSPETELFNKGQILFGLDHAYRSIIKEDKVIIVEGYFDAIALHQAGINNVVASLGTALSIYQIKQVLKYSDSKEVILNFDADKAGIKATEKAINQMLNLAYQGQIKLRIINIPDGKDADEFLKHSPDSAYQELINHAPLWIDWQIRKMVENQDLSQSDIFQKVNQSMVNLLINIVNDDLLTYYINFCGEILSQGNSKKTELYSNNLVNNITRYWQNKLREEPNLPLPIIVKNRLESDKKPFLKNQQIKSDKITIEPDLSKAEILLIKLYIYFPEYRLNIIFEIEERNLLFSLSHHRLLWQKIMEIQKINQEYAEELLLMDSTELISKIQDKIEDNSLYKKEIQKVLNLDHLTEKTELIGKVPQSIKNAAASMERIMTEKECLGYLERWKKSDIRINREKTEEYYNNFNNLKQKIKELDAELNFHFFYR